MVRPPLCDPSLALTWEDLGCLRKLVHHIQHIEFESEALSQEVSMLATVLSPEDALADSTETAEQVSQKLKQAKVYFKEGSEAKLSKVCWALPNGIKALGGLSSVIDNIENDRQHTRELPTLQVSVDHLTKSLKAEFGDVSGKPPLDDEKLPRIRCRAGKIAEVNKSVNMILKNSTKKFQSSNGKCLFVVKSGMSMSINMVLSIISEAFWHQVSLIIKSAAEHFLQASQVTADLCTTISKSKIVQVAITTKLDGDFIGMFPSAEMSRQLAALHEKRATLFAVASAAAKAITTTSTCDLRSDKLHKMMEVCHQVIDDSSSLDAVLSQLQQPAATQESPAAAEDQAAKVAEANAAAAEAAEAPEADAKEWGKPEQPPAAAANGDQDQDRRSINALTLLTSQEQVHWGLVCIWMEGFRA